MIRSLRVPGTTWRSLSSTANQTSSTSQRPKTAIPPAIQRSPTDMLEALSSTVGVDPTAPHFAFIDDPAMIPSTAQNKRNYFMAKEMGKRAARQLAEEWPTLFAFDRDQPRLPAFRPQKQPDPLQVEPTEENLLKMIEKKEIRDAAMLYERIRADNKDINKETQLALFKAVCYYNGKNPPFAELEDWPGMRNFAEENITKWTEAGVADLLFETLPQTPETISTLIAGLCKFGSPESVQRAKNLFKEHYASLHLEAFNAIITVSTWNDCNISVLEKMKKAGLRPEISTFNSLLESASKMKNLDRRTEATESILGEMLSMEIQPSLRTFTQILKNSSDFDAAEVKDTNKSSDGLTKLVTWLVEIIAELEKRPEIVSHRANDHLFFLEAMNVSVRASNLELAARVVNLYESKSNKVRLPALTAEGMFYNRYLVLFVQMTNSLDAINEKHRSLVPRIVGVGRQLSTIVLEKLKILYGRITINKGNPKVLLSDLQYKTTKTRIIINLFQQKIIENKNEVEVLVRRKCIK